MIKNRFNKRIIVLVIVLTSLTFFMPREAFDGHFGVDYDIFCRLMCTFGADTINDAVLTEKPKESYFLFVFKVFSSIHSSANQIHSKRAPPAASV